MSEQIDLDALVEGLKSTSYAKANAAFDDLETWIGSAPPAEALQALVGKLEPLAGHASSVTRARALPLLGKALGEKALPILAKHLGDPDPEVRAAVEDVAEEIGEPARKLLEQLAGDPDFGVRFWAAVALSEAGNAAGYDALVDGLSTGYTRFEALQSLRRLADPRAEAPVRKVLGKWFLPAIDRVAGAGVLARFGDSRAKETLLKEIPRKRSDVRGLAMEIASDLALPEAIPLLVGVLKDSRDPFRGGAAIALGRMKAASCHDDIARLLGDENDDADIRAQAAEGLAALGNDQAKRTLEHAAGTVKAREVGEAVREALLAFASAPRP